MKRKFTIGSRGSQLALWQTDFVKTRLEKRFPQAAFDVLIIRTTGDVMLDTALSKIGDKGLFTKQIETALLKNQIDLAVHSLKDLPTTQPDKLKIGAVSAREIANDVFISKNFQSIEDLPPNARVATGSLRRKSQLLHFRPDLKVVEIRGNVPTRIEKFLNSDLDGLILAFAGVHRLNLDSHIKQIVPTEIMLPAVGQGAMAVEIREGDSEIAKMLAEINDQSTEFCVAAERAFLRSLEGGCQVPIGGFAVLDEGEIFLEGFVGNLTGAKIIRHSMRGNKTEAKRLGETLAEICLQRGAAEILEEARKASEKSVGEVV
ncbi:MAG: hydroxymethylbilane synthase [Acidobacteriota bacterium]|nr:hydroxymethylbilane synthase [Acidobacteriota bacterium]